MSAETARAAVASLPFVRAVDVLEQHPGQTPGQVSMHVTTDPGMDWPEVAAQLDAVGLVGEVLHVDDPARNLDDLRRTEAAFAGQQLEERRSAWRVMADLDAESVAIRALLPQLAALAPDGDQASDPRLQEVQRIVDAEIAFWREVLAPAGGKEPGPDAQATPMPIRLGVNPVPARDPAPEQVAAKLGRARLLLGYRRWFVTRSGFARVNAICTEVGAHALATADRASDPAIAAKYRTLAARCHAAAKSIQLAFAP